MGQARGYKSSVVIDFETTFGVDPGVPDGKVMPINSYDVSASRALNSAQTITGNRSPVMPFTGFTSVQGQAVIPVDIVAMGYWLKGIFGDPTTTGAGPYTHVFKIGDTQPSMVIEKTFDFGGGTKTYIKQNGVKLGSLGINFGGDGELTAQIGVVGSKESAPNATPYDATPVAVSLNRVGNFQAAITEGGSAIATVTECSITLELGLDSSGYVIGGGGSLGDIPEGLASVSGSITALFKDTALLTKAAAGTESSLAITLTSTTHSLKFEIPELLFQLQTPGITGPQGVRVTLPFQGYLDNGTGASAMIVTLINATADY